MALQGPVIARAAPYGSLHFRDGIGWIIDDVVVDDVVTKMMGGTGARMSGVLRIEFELIPAEVTSIDVGMGGPYEPRG